MCNFTNKAEAKCNFNDRVVLLENSAATQESPSEAYGACSPDETSILLIASPADVCQPGRVTQL